MTSDLTLKLRILIVDDDKKLLSLLESLLLEENHEVITCHTGLEAMKKCREKRFDLLISDLMMPGASGIEVLKESRKTQPDCLVIIITGYASLETAVEAIREGAYDYITKPFKLEELKIVVNNAREKIGLIRENRRLLEELQNASEQLYMVKKVMGAGTDDELGREKRAQERNRDGPLIAGSMLPSYYLDNQTVGTGGSFLHDLERISDLRSKGYLSEEEFSLCKSRLLKNLKR
jgi:CheY-like chemotaxis protein